MERRRRWSYDNAKVLCCLMCSIAVRAMQVNRWEMCSNWALLILPLGGSKLQSTANNRETDTVHIQTFICWAPPHKVNQQNDDNSDDKNRRQSRWIWLHLYSLTQNRNK